MLGGQDLGQLALAGIEQVAEAEHDGLTLGQRGVPPGRECRRGRRDGGLDLGGAGETDVLGGDTQGGVVDRGGPPARGRDGGAVDPVGDEGKRCVGHRGSFGAMAGRVPGGLDLTLRATPRGR